MSAELDKARLALAHAKDLDANNERDERTALFSSRHVEVAYGEAIKIAEVNALIAQAAALEELTAIATKNWRH